MIDKLLKKFGYIKEINLSPMDVNKMFAAQFGDVSDYVIDRKQQEELFQDLKEVEGFTDYLKATIAKDIQRHFSAGTEKEQDIIKGATSRTAFFLTNLTKPPVEPDTGSTLNNPRYGK